MSWLTAALAFALSMLLFTTMVSVMVESVHRLLSLRHGGPPVPLAAEMQRFLNRMPGVFIDVDGRPGEKTSDALKRVTGHYLVGDPRNEI